MFCHGEVMTLCSPDSNMSKSVWIPCVPDVGWTMLLSVWECCCHGWFMWL